MSILLTPEELGNIRRNVECPDAKADLYLDMMRFTDEVAKAIAQAQAQKIIEWGVEICMNVDHENYRTYKHECRNCWQALKAELEGK